MSVITTEPTSIMSNFPPMGNPAEAAENQLLEPGEDAEETRRKQQLAQASAVFLPEGNTARQQGGTNDCCNGTEDGCIDVLCAAFCCTCDNAQDTDNTAQSTGCFDGDCDCDCDCSD